MSNTNRIISAWHGEHQQFFGLLSGLEAELDIFHSGRDPHYTRMLDILSDVRRLGDTSHHPMEDVAFARLRSHRPDLELVLNRLRQQHVVISHAGDKLAELLRQGLGGEVTRRADIETAAATYLVYYRSHIRMEEEQILPIAARELTPHDWRAVQGTELSISQEPAPVQVSAPSGTSALPHAELELAQGPSPGGG